MSADDFLDSNVLVYSVDTGFPEKRQRAMELVTRSVNEATGCISFQVVQETLNVLIGRLGTPVDRLRVLMDDVLSPCGKYTLQRPSTRAQSRSRAATSSPSMIP